MKVPVDHAKPQLTDPTNTPEAKATAGADLIAKVTASPNLANAKEVQSNLAEFTIANTALDGNNKSRVKAREALTAADVAEPPLLRRWIVRKSALLLSIQSFGDGSKQLVQTFNVAVAEKHVAPLATVPQGLHPMKTRKPTYASVRWTPTPGAHGYMLQHCVNPNDPTTFVGPISVSQAKFHLAGQTAGTTVYFRVLACDAALPNGQTTYTAWVPVVVIG